MSQQVPTTIERGTRSHEERARPERVMPMDAYRVAGRLVVHVDLLDSDPRTASVSLDRDVVAVTAAHSLQSVKRRNHDRGDSHGRLSSERLERRSRAMVKANMSADCYNTARTISHGERDKSRRAADLGDFVARGRRLPAHNAMAAWARGGELPDGASGGVQCARPSDAITRPRQRTPWLRRRRQERRAR